MSEKLDFSGIQEKLTKEAVERMQIRHGEDLEELGPISAITRTIAIGALVIPGIKAELQDLHDDLEHNGLLHEPS